MANTSEPCPIQPCKKSILLENELCHLKESISKELHSLGAKVDKISSNLFGNGAPGVTERLRDHDSALARGEIQFAELRGIMVQIRRISLGVAGSVVGGVILYVAKLIMGDAP